MVHRVGLVVMQVLEVRGIRVAKIEGHESVTIIDSVEFLAFHELFNILLHNGSLMNGGSLSSCGVNTNAVAESKDVFKALVLKSVWVHIDNTLAISNLRIKKLLVRLAGRVNYSCEEVLLNHIS